MEDLNVASDSTGTTEGASKITTKRTVEDEDQNTSKKKGKGNDDSGEDDDSSNSSFAPKGKWVNEQDLFAQNTLIYRLKETVEHHEFLLKEFTKKVESEEKKSLLKDLEKMIEEQETVNQDFIDQVQSERRDRIKELVDKRKKCLSKIHIIDGDIRRIQKFIDTTERCYGVKDD